MATSSNVLLICKSVHHGNTLKVARKMADVLGADIKDPKDVILDDIDAYSLIGFGSGIYNRKPHQDLTDLIDKIEYQQHRSAFIFSTATIPWPPTLQPLRDKLKQKGFTIIGEFSCKGFIDEGFVKYIFGGLNKGRPNEKDLNKATRFAQYIRNKYIQTNSQKISSV